MVPYNVFTLYATTRHFLTKDPMAVWIHSFFSETRNFLERNQFFNILEWTSCYRWMVIHMYKRYNIVQIWMAHSYFIETGYTDGWQFQSWLTVKNIPISITRVYERGVQSVHRSQILNFERGLSLSPGPQSNLVLPCKISLGGPVNYPHVSKPYCTLC
jgi:hypothetical protein